MSYFKDEDEVHAFLGQILKECLADEELGPKFRQADTVVRYEYADPDTSVTVPLEDGAGPDDVDFGDSEREPEVVMRMDADTAHRFWLGEVNVTVALARGQIKAKGPVAKVLKLVPLTKPVFPKYRQMIEDSGRDDLLDV
ncbi:MAG: SCP2 sterol-binding domain-containing protein [Solirubrobacterales bacterium]